MSIKSIGQLLAEYLQERSDTAPDQASKERWDEVLQVAVQGLKSKSEKPANPGDAK